MKPKTFVVVATLLIAAAVAASALAQTSAPRGTTSTFVLRFLGPTGFVDNPPKTAKKNGFPNRLSPGDTLLSHSLVYDATNTKHLGRTSELCTVTVASPLTFDCSMALLFANGSELLVHGALNPTQPGWSAPVVGGKGRYAGARGSIKISDVHSNQPAERWTFTLVD